MPGPLDLAAAAAGLALAISAVLILPGAAALDLAGHRAAGMERLALAVGASVTLWPLILLWTTLAGWRWSAGSFGGFVAMAAVIVAVGRYGRARDFVRPSPASLTLALILALAVGVRIWQARDLVAPPWVDGLHHTIITQLIADGGAVPSTFRPYLEVDRFYYHFGFHALAAGAAWLSGAETRTAVLWLGQALGALAALTTWAVARRLVGRPVAALAAAAVPACLYWFPAYFVSWARFTQLAGLVALPAVWLMVADATRRRRPVRLHLLAAACCAGLLLVHYRVFVFFAWGVAVAVAVGLADRRRRDAAGSEDPSAVDRSDVVDASLGPPSAHLMRLAAVSVVALALISPWLARNFAAGVGELAAVSPTWYVGSTETVDAVGLTARQDWLFTQGTNGFWLHLAWLGIAVAMWRGRRAAWAVALGLLGAALTVAPGWIGLSTSWMLPPFVLAISLFLPVAWGVAWWVEAAIDAFPMARRGPLIAIAACIAGAWLARHDPGLPAAVLEGDARALLPELRAIGDRGEAMRLAAMLLQIGGLVGLASVFRYERAEIAAVEMAGSGRADASDRLVEPAASVEPAEPVDAVDAVDPTTFRRRARELAPYLAIVALCAAGAWRMRVIVNRETVIARPADVTAAAWIRAHTPADARFVVRTSHWQLQTYRGLDGGYWLPLLAGRATTMPAALYVYGDPADVRATQAMAEALARGDALDDAAIDAAMRRAGADYIYLGPQASTVPGTFTAERLRRHPGLDEVYAADGVNVFARRGGAKVR